MNIEPKLDWLIHSTKNEDQISTRSLIARLNLPLRDQASLEVYIATVVKPADFLSIPDFYEHYKEWNLSPREYKDHLAEQDRRCYSKNWFDNVPKRFFTDQDRERLDQNPDILTLSAICRKNGYPLTQVEIESIIGYAGKDLNKLGVTYTKYAAWEILEPKSKMRCMVGSPRLDLIMFGDMNLSTEAWSK